MLIEISIENKDKIIKKCLEDVRKKYSDFKFIDTDKISIDSEHIQNTEFGITFKGVLSYPKLNYIILSNYELFIDIKGYIHFHIWYVIVNEYDNMNINCDSKNEVISYNLDDLIKEMNYSKIKDLMIIKQN